MIKNIIIILSLTLARFGPNLVLIFFFFFFVGFSWIFTLFQVIIVRNFKENQLTKLEKMAKNLVSRPILAPWAKIWIQKLFCGFYLY